MKLMSRRSFLQVPAVMTDRYARLNHGYTDARDCADYSIHTKPQACLDGSADAQNAVAIEQMISNTLTFFTSSLIGSISDEYGRKGELFLLQSILRKQNTGEDHSYPDISQESSAWECFCHHSRLYAWSFYNFSPKCLLGGTTDVEHRLDL